MKASERVDHVAFLRGINVGGHAVIKMSDLKATFEIMGLKNVRTLLASGNVIFESSRTDEEALAKSIEAELKKAFHRDIRVIVRNLEALKKLRSSEPFKGIKLTPSLRFYITFLSGNIQSPPADASEAKHQDGLRILRTTPGEVISVIDLSRGKGTTDLMGRLEKEYGANATTRNWNTVLKILG
jgi:uncharacterized protein (DUF1697 family)